jgi:hypothetical protein
VCRVSWTRASTRRRRSPWSRSRSTSSAPSSSA